MVRLSKDEALVQLQREQELSRPFGGCVMCRLASPGHAHEWIAENEHGCVVLDAYGSTPGHLLVISKSHVERTSALTQTVFFSLQALVWEANNTLEAELGPQRVYVATLGSSQQLPTSFPHFHTHVVPVYETDDRARPAYVFSWSSGVERYCTSDFAGLQNRLRGAWTAHSPNESNQATSCELSRGNSHKTPPASS
jgi:histidine triad (HIT) family protein